jgi:2-polyprenyl-3-methyl-5-hydroxy-6-metoxy-1,4-benzoquinol methylase
MFIGSTDRFTDGEREDVLRHFRCVRCGLVYIGNVVRNEALQQGYLEIDARQYYAEVGAATRRKFETSIRDLDKLLQPSSAILDIGAGNGMFIAMLREHGFHTVDGHEIPGAHVFAVEDTDCRLYRDFDYESIPSSSYDAITLVDVAEHVPDPQHLFNACRRILKPGGILYIHTPVVTRLDRAMHFAQRVPGLRKAGRMWQRVRTSLSHLQNFTPCALQIALRGAGFEVVSLAVANELSWPVTRYVRVHLCERLGLPPVVATLLYPIAYPVVATNIFNANKAVVCAVSAGTSH